MWDELYVKAEDPKVNVKDLRQLCKALGVSDKGGRHDLLKAICDATILNKEKRAKRSPTVLEAEKALLKGSRADEPEVESAQVADEKPEEKEVSRMESKKEYNWLHIGISALFIFLAVVTGILVGTFLAEKLFPVAAAPSQPPAVAPATSPATGLETSKKPETTTSSVEDEQAVCRLDKVATIYEVESAERQRIEIGGHGTQHVDYYPDRGVKTISYIVPAISPPEVPDIWWGFGSIWEGQLPECADFNWVADATGYAEARLDSGHSGVVIDLRVSDPKKQVVANVAGLSESQIDALKEVHRQGMEGKPPSAAASEPSAAVVEAPSAPVAGQPGCPPAEDRTYTADTDVTVTGPAIAHPWWRHAFDQAQFRVLLGSGETATFLGMQGKTYVYQDTQACRTNMDDEFANANFPVKTVDELRDEGLVR